MGKTSLKTYALAVIILLIIDAIWLFVIMKDFYITQLSGFVRPQPVPLWPAISAWLLIALGVVVFVNNNTKNSRQSITYGALYGFILYGVYDFTNYALLAQWTLSMVIVDILWGTCLCATLAYCVHIAQK